MTVLWNAFQYPLGLNALTREDIIMTAAFFIMFFVIYGLRDLFIKHIPRKPGSILDEILNETWDDYEEEENEEPVRSDETSAPTAAEPENRGEKIIAADASDGE